MRGISFNEGKHTRGPYQHMGCCSFNSRRYDAGLDGQWTDTGMEGGLCMIVLVGNTATCTLYSVGTPQ